MGKVHAYFCNSININWGITSGLDLTQKLLKENVLK